MAEGKIDIEKENKKLRAELAILRANLVKMEKENDSLKLEKSKLVVNRLEVEQELKKKLGLREKESKIEENQRKAFKMNTHESQSTISPKYILQSTLDFTTVGSDSTLQSDTFLKNLRFFKDFFFDDFYSIPDDKAIEVVDFFSTKSLKAFLEAFSLFSCKKAVFFKFLPPVYSENSFIKVKVSTLLEVPPDWIIEVYEPRLKIFIAENKTLLVELFANMAEKAPFYLKQVLDKQTFNAFITYQNPHSYKLLYFVVTQKIKDYIDETNLHLIPEELACHYFSMSKDEYIESYTE